MLSFSDPLATFDWSDESGLASTGSQCPRRRFSQEYQRAISGSESMKKVWNFIASNPVAAFDQVHITSDT
jgi:hypothetical protein